jgi:signal transduction histidine kinase
VVSWVVRRWPGPARSRLFDVTWACTLAVISVGALWVKRASPPDLRSPDALGVVLALTSSRPRVWRRRHPSEVLVLVGVASVSLEVLRYPSASGSCVLVALYTVAATSERRRSLQALAGTALAIVVVLAANWRDLTVIDVVANYLVFGTAWILGDNVRTRRKYVAELEDKARRLEAEHEAEARRSVTEERARIARELHDVVAHSVSVMTVQAGAARRLLDRSDAEPAVREAMATVEATGREALAELRRAVGVLREDGESAGLGPQPGVADLPALVARAREAGLSVELATEGEPRPLPSGVDLSAYRIAQEALTNAAKHAPGAPVAVHLAIDGSVELTVDSGGRPRAGRGLGLESMRERAESLGGTLAAGPGGSGWRIHAVLPVRAGRLPEAAS